jgi:hypothetical protein
MLFGFISVSFSFRFYSFSLRKFIYISGVGGGSDSFFEYLFKVGIFFNDHTYLTIFEIFYNAYMKYTKFGNWYMEVNMDDPKQIFRTCFESLQGFWPGLQVLFGMNNWFSSLAVYSLISIVS